MTRVADHVQAQGVRFAYHHHLGTVVERPADLDALLRHTGASVGLTLDTGHAALGGIDPLEVIRAHPARVAHVHCKDVRREVFARSEEHTSELQSLMRISYAVFCLKKKKNETQK